VMQERTSGAFGWLLEGTCGGERRSKLYRNI